mgnify:CR=1 FL=1
MFPVSINVWIRHNYRQLIWRESMHYIVVLLTARLCADVMCTCIITLHHHIKCRNPGEVQQVLHFGRARVENRLSVMIQSQSNSVCIFMVAGVYNVRISRYKSLSGTSHSNMSKTRENHDKGNMSWQLSCGFENGFHCSYQPPSK